MTNDEAKKEIEKLCDEYNKKEDIIVEEAKANGMYKPGLDSNRELFAEAENEFKIKMQTIIDAVE